MRGAGGHDILELQGSHKSDHQGGHDSSIRNLGTNRGADQISKYIYCNGNKCSHF